SSSFTQLVPSASRASWAVRIASLEVRHPAVFGRTSIPRRFSSPKTLSPPAAPLGAPAVPALLPARKRRIATVVSWVPLATSAFSSSVWLVAPPVPMIRCESNFLPAISSIYAFFLYLSVPSFRRLGGGGHRGWLSRASGRRWP